jgi:hypothetical protein
VAEGDSLTQTENIDEGAPESEVVEDPQPLSADAQDASLRPLYVRGPGILEDRTLNLVGRYGLPLVLFPNVFTPADAMELQTEFLRQLANAAETKKRSQQVLECGSAVLARPDPVLPALATFGRLENKMTLVMAFAWSDGPDGPLERFMVWSWPKGDCDAIPGYRAGFINR